MDRFQPKSALGKVSGKEFHVPLAMEPLKHLSLPASETSRTSAVCPITGLGDALLNTQIGPEQRRRFLELVLEFQLLARGGSGGIPFDATQVDKTRSEDQVRSLGAMLENLKELDYPPELLAMAARIMFRDPLAATLASVRELRKVITISLDTFGDIFLEKLKAVVKTEYGSAFCEETTGSKWMAVIMGPDIDFQREYSLYSNTPRSGRFAKIATLFFGPNKTEHLLVNITSDFKRYSVKVINQEKLDRYVGVLKELAELTPEGGKIEI